MFWVRCRTVNSFRCILDKEYVIVPAQINRNNTVFNVSPLSKNGKITLQSKIDKLPIVVKSRPQPRPNGVTIASRSIKLTPPSAYSEQVIRKSYAQRQKDNMNEGVMYGAGGFASLFAACLVSGIGTVAAPVIIPGGFLALSFIFCGGVARKAYDISREKRDIPN